MRENLIIEKYFGADGFRREAGITLAANHAYKVGRFLGWYNSMLRERNDILVDVQKMDKACDVLQEYGFAST